MFHKIDHAADHTLKSIRLQILKAILTIGALVFLATHQFHFLYHAVASHPELNLLIIAVFIFGMAVALRSIFALSHDERALRWMKETYSDVTVTETKTGDQDLVRILRVTEPAKLFALPKIVGQVFELAMEEMMQNRSFHVSLAQRNAMMAMIHESINREKSLVHYMTGVMILLGLIGTFIGLMEMVASVGGIVGGLAKAGSGSDEAIKGVIKDLEAPLTGMATGFSASLFGLLGSLVLGLVARFGQTATLVLKHDLEHWLTKISQLEAPHQTGMAGASHGPNAAVASLATSLVGSFRTIQGILMRSSDVMRKLADRQDEQTAAMNRLTASIDELSVRQEQALWQLRRVDAIGDSVESMRSEAILSEKSLSNRLTMEFGRVIDVMDRVHDENKLQFADVVEQHRVTERLSRSLELQAARGFEELSLKSAAIATDQAEIKRLLQESQDVISERLRHHSKPIDFAAMSDRLGAAVDERLAAGFGAIAASLDKALSGLADSLKQFGEAHGSTMMRLQEISAHPLADEMRNLSKSIEAGLSTGFADLSRVMDVMISAQAFNAAGMSREDDLDLSKSSPDSSPAEISEPMSRSQDHASVRKAFRDAVRLKSDTTK